MFAKDQSIREGEITTSDREKLSRRGQGLMQTWRIFQSEG